jgi:hypothetical protein
MQAASHPRVSFADYALIFLLLLGIYLEVAIYLSPTIPIPSVLAGAAGLVLIWRRRDDFTARQLAAFMGVILTLVAACLAAPDWSFLPKRMTGLIQFTYSLVVAFAFYLTLIHAERRVLARMLMGMCIVILVGAQLEAIPAIREISDGARQILYRSGVYESDLRDLLFYGKVRPKFFTSEPSAVTFSFSLLSLGWFLASDSRRRWLIFGLLMLASQLIIPGPTTLLGGIAAGLSYLMLPQSKAAGGLGKASIVVFSGIAIAALLIAGSFLYADRIEAIMAGRDPSFFYRVIGPALVAIKVIAEYPLTGIGLTSEQFGADLAMNVFVQSPSFSSAWRFERLSEVLTNYFWLHWIYLGLVFGALVLIALNIWLRSLNVANLAYCWLVWALFGQASGAYVGPKTWVVLMMVAGLTYSMRRIVPAPAQVGLPKPQPVMTQSGLVLLPGYRHGRLLS